MRFLLLLMLPLLTAARWDDFMHKFTDICIKGRVMCGKDVAGVKEVELMDEDLFRDDQVFVVKTEADGTFEGCGTAKDFVTAPEPEFYMRFHEVCGKSCLRFNIGDIPKNPDGSIEVNTEDIDLTGGDEYIKIIDC